MNAIAIVTGASSGLGRQFALQLSRQSWWNLDEVWLVARRRQELENTASRLGRPARIFDLDLAVPESLRRLEEALGERRPRVQILVNNAGFGAYGLFQDLPLDRQLGMIDLNVRALTALSHLVLPYMERGSVLLNVASLAAYFPLAHFAVYAATKAYVRSLSVALAAELEPRGILVHTLSPGPVRTEFAVVASAGAKPFMDYGQDPAVTVRRCLRTVRRRRWWSLPSVGWRIMAWFSRWVSAKTVARFSRRFMKRESLGTGQ